MREYKTIRALMRGDIVDIGGIRFKGLPREVKPGDLYIGERNTGPHLLEAREIHKGAVYPTGSGYPYDLSECVPVEEVP